MGETQLNRTWNEIKTNDSWAIFKIMSEFVNGFEKMSKIGPCVSIFGSDDLLSLSKSGFHLVGLKGYDQMPFKFSGRVCTLFQSLGQLDGGPSSSAFFSMASLGSKAVGFLSSGSNIEPNLDPTTNQDIFEKDVTTEVRVIGFIGNKDDDSCTCPTDVHLRCKHPADKDGDQCLGGLTKLIDRVNTLDGSGISENSGDW